MEFEQKKLTKTVFGNYRAAEVDSLLAEVTQHLQQQEAAQAEEASRVREELAQAESLAAELKALQEASERLREENSRLAERSRALYEECRTREAEEHSLRSELEKLRLEAEGVRTELDLANSQNAILDNRVARQKRELEEKDRLLLADPVGEANKRAELIVQNAMNVSKQMLDDAEDMRSRALASVRAAYFNAMGFRQSLEERFVNLQNDLDQSMRALRAIEAEGEHSAADTVQEKW